MWKRTAPKSTAARSTIAYVRVSSEDQAEHGVSLDAQEARIASYCTALGFQVSEVIRDAGESAKSLQRPGIAMLLERLRAGEIERVVVLKLDRITRSIRDLDELLETFAKHDAALVSVSEQLDTASAAGRMVTNMLGVVAQWEREAIGERTAFALEHKRRNRQVYGKAPFGYRRDGNRLVEVPEELEALREARAMFDAGASYRKIGAMFEARGIAPGGKAWHAASVRAVLRSRMAQEVA